MEECPPGILPINPGSPEPAVTRFKIPAVALSFLGGACLLVGATGCSPPLAATPGPGRPLPFDVLDSGSRSGVRDARQLAIRSEAEWRRLWQEHRPSGSEPPPVDFGRQMVAAIFMGQQSTSGYSIRVTAVEWDGAGVTVVYATHTPPRGAMVAQVLTQPFEMIRIDRIGTPIQFHAR